MDSRREFLKKAALLAGSTGLQYSLPASIRKALEIDPAAGSTYLDAEHVVFLMQENRSFDHCYGTLQGVRGFNDPRAITLPNRNLVWMQPDKNGDAYAPFRLNLKDTKATWIGSLPHSWTNQVDARNGGLYDKWLEVKHSGHPEYHGMPLTMGYYTREDIPFYYALADSFTVCDQHFCSSLTGTTPNRLYFWSGTIRAEQHEGSKAHVWNEDADYDSMVSWKTYPERLEENGISWKVYQNDLSVPGEYTDEQDAWMANFGDNPLEYFTQYNVRLSLRYIRYLHQQLDLLPREIEQLEREAAAARDGNTGEELRKKIAGRKKLLGRVREDAAVFTREKYEALPPQEKALHEKAFADNRKDPNFYKLTTLTYKDPDTQAAREVTIPEGDILHGFREDVASGKLPTVSWLVAPENFSDHPSAAWYGAWYISEVLDILTRQPDVWKKTIFVLTYDENDGYFDHVPPFVAPDPARPETGKISRSLDARTEFVTMEQEKARVGSTEQHMRESAIGLGYRVPMVVASPWSRGGWVNSEVFDHTSALRFLENFLEHKTGKKIRETNISSWRRAVCGDLSSVFRPFDNSVLSTPAFPARDTFIESIHQARFKPLPAAFRKLSAAEISQANQSPRTSPWMPQQEKGTRPACALPYELLADMHGDGSAGKVGLRMEAGTKLFGSRSAGAPFLVYAPGGFRNEPMRVWSYGVAPGEWVEDSWTIRDFKEGVYHLQVHGPNGFFREFRGDAAAPRVEASCSYQQGNLRITVLNHTPGKGYPLEIVDNAYSNKPLVLELGAAGSKTASATLTIPAEKSHGWYDVSLRIPGHEIFGKRWAGRIETGTANRTDPAMGLPGA